MQQIKIKKDIEQMFNIQEKENGEIAVSARELHKALKVKTRFSLWVTQNFKFLKENYDFTSVVTTTVVNNGAVRHLDDYALTTEAAKHIAMMSGTKKGFEVRDYFIKIEKAWNSPEMIMQRALNIANNTIYQLEAKIERDKPKIVFADAVATTKTSILVGELAKIIKQNGVNIGQRRLFEWLRQNGYLIKRKGVDYNMPTQYSMERELFEIKETTISHSDGHTSISKTPKVTGKGQQYFVNKFLNQEE
ncbi:oxidoreductase [Staphylococcus pseudintermedius]|uniref:phage antirepressor KilAC domain-containing protein n=1 Tax=Staphylococcus pseudintermedius TaxID=283734 RepID=UPI001121B0D6|nr:phage antirepressor KilAC domain-containing protein [Staphylococcus pseudintermedius]EII2105032.1 phage antirepressor KilAC domain-containing protein [Staphylococcus pseudintermedius]EJA1901096.1 phage antirepressor KilAC domain-containing protein [Staphylococcus pseudintermedius]EJG5600856.1 phage antirepressor KilAC domain-containing protein [Staphylococcus pseudintermedius]EJY3775967.1 phage antirepressor KilAC domain-containing protein [Staphylococcus pseudintermedius]ELD8082559.1 phage